MTDEPLGRDACVRRLSVETQSRDQGRQRPVYNVIGLAAIPIATSALFCYFRSAYEFWRFIEPERQMGRTLNMVV